MSNSVLKIGIISKEDYIKRTVAIAKGQYKVREDEPKVWFESIKSVAQVLSSENQQLLKLIAKYQPHSLTELEKLSHRKKANLSRTLHTLAKYNIVELPKVNGAIAPVVKATDFQVEFGLNTNYANG